MSMYMLALITVVATISSPVAGCEHLPLEREVGVSLRNINNEFLRAEQGQDCWGGFTQLVNRVEQYRAEASAPDLRRVERLIVSNLTLYSFACAYDDDPVKADFSTRLACVRGVSRFETVRSDTNCLFRVAEWLSRAVPLDVSQGTFEKDSKEAYERDCLMIYGGKTPPRYPGSVGNTRHYGPFMRACFARLEFRRLYNERLLNFRAEALACLREATMKGYKDLLDCEREKIWTLFCKRACGNL